MKNCFIIAGSATFLAFATPASAQQGTDQAAPASTAEINYDEGELGYASLMQGRYRSAIEQIKSEGRSQTHDPAKLINLGHAHSKLGEADEARQYYQAALKSRQSFDIILADGRVMNSRDAARAALRRLDSQ